MKVLLAIMLVMSSYVYASTGGFHPHEESRFETNETNITNLQTAGSMTSAFSEGTKMMRTAWFTFDVATDGGAIGASSLGVSLPAKAVLVRTLLYVVTQFVESGGSSIVAIHCEDANNLFSAANIVAGKPAGTYFSGVQTGANSAVTGAIAASCNITATVATAKLTAGKLNGFIEYFVSE